MRAIERSESSLVWGAGGPASGLGGTPSQSPSSVTGIINGNQVTLSQNTVSVFDGHQTVTVSMTSDTESGIGLSMTVDPPSPNGPSACGAVVSVDGVSVSCNDGTAISCDSSGSSCSPAGDGSTGDW